MTLNYNRLNPVANLINFVRHRESLSQVIRIFIHGHDFLHTMKNTRVFERGVVSLTFIHRRCSAIEVVMIFEKRSICHKGDLRLSQLSNSVWRKEWKRTQASVTFQSSSLFDDEHKRYSLLFVRHVWWCATSGDKRCLFQLIWIDWCVSNVEELNKYFNRRNM